MNSYMYIAMDTKEPYTADANIHLNSHIKYRQVVHFLLSWYFSILHTIIIHLHFLCLRTTQPQHIRHYAWVHNQSHVQRISSLIINATLLCSCNICLDMRNKIVVSLLRLNHDFFTTYCVCCWDIVCGYKQSSPSYLKPTQSRFYCICIMNVDSKNAKINTRQTQGTIDPVSLQYWLCFDVDMGLGLKLWCGHKPHPGRTIPIHCNFVWGERRTVLTVY